MRSSQSSFDEQFHQSKEPQTPILWAYEKGHDQIVHSRLLEFNKYNVIKIY